MNQYPFSQNRWFKILFSLFFLGILLFSRDTLLTLNILGFPLSQLLTVLLFLGAGILFLFCRRSQLKQILTDRRMLLMLFSAVLMLVPMILKRDWQLMYLSILFYILAGIFLSYFLDIRTAARYYVTILSVLSVYSVLCTYVLRILPDRGILSVPVFVNSKGFSFYNFGLAQVSIDYVSKRNFGIFREPGVYQFFLLLGLYLNNYRADWEKNRQLWTINLCLAFSMLTTFATGGVIEMGLLAIFLFFDKKWYRQRKARLAAYGLILLDIAGAAWILLTKNSLYVEFMGMITKFGSEESGASRFDAIFTDLQIFLKHPLLGDTVKNVLHVVENNTTTTMVSYAMLGILGGSLHVAGWAALSWDRERGVISNLFLLLILFMSFNTQNLSWNLIFWLFPMLALAERVLPLLQNAKKKRT